MLLNANADVNAISAEGKTCLMVCMEQKDNYMFCQMMAYGPEIDTVDTKGWNVLIWAIRQGMLKLFIHEMGTKLTGESLFLACHYQDPQGFSPLHHAVMMDKYGDVKLICDLDLQYRYEKKEALVMIPDANGTTPLHIGAQNGNLDILDTLCSVVADLDPVNQWGETPLLIGARCGDLAVVTHLLDTHHHFVAAQADVVDNTGKGLLHHAVLSGQLDLVNTILVNKDGDNRRFSFPPFDINHVDKEGFTAVMIASREMQWQVIPSLVMAKANVHNGDRDGWTALMHAAYGGCTDTVCVLIDSRSALDMQDNAGCTALMHAVSLGNTECAECLIDARADLRVRNFTLQTALMVVKSTPQIKPSRRAACEEIVLDALREEEVRGRMCPDRGPGSIGLRKPEHVRGYIVLTIIGADELWLEGHQPHELNTYAYAECAPNAENRASCLTACCLSTNKPVFYETVRFDVPRLEADGVIVVVLFACTGKPLKLMAEMQEELKPTKVKKNNNSSNPDAASSALEKRFRQLQKAREKLLQKEAKAAKELNVEPTAADATTLQARRWANLELNWRLAGFGDYIALPPMPKGHYPLGFVTIRAASIQHVVAMGEPVKMSRQIRGSQSGRLHMELDFRADNIARCCHENPGWPGEPSVLSATPREGLLSGSDGGPAFPMPPLQDPASNPTVPWGQPRPLVIQTDTGEG
jgi:ankyrin repeat protein